MKRIDIGAALSAPSDVMQPRRVSIMRTGSIRSLRFHDPDRAEHAPACAIEIQSARVLIREPIPHEAEDALIEAL
jgi:hypothetical protein